MMKSTRKLLKVAFILAIFYSMTSCESDSEVDFFQSAELEVFVSGTLSGNPRSGLTVAIYNTEEDAQNEVNAVTFPQTTDGEGFAFFLDLEPGFRYWVRVDTTLIHNINLSEVLETGYNEMSMTIL